MNCPETRLVSEFALQPIFHLCQSCFLPLFFHCPSSLFHWCFSSEHSLINGLDTNLHLRFPFWKFSAGNSHPFSAQITCCITLLPAQMGPAYISNLLRKPASNPQMGCRSPLPKCIPLLRTIFSKFSLLSCQGGTKPPLSPCHHRCYQSFTFEIFLLIHATKITSIQFKFSKRTSYFAVLQEWSQESPRTCRAALYQKNKILLGVMLL